MTMQEWEQRVLAAANEAADAWGAIEVVDTGASPFWRWRVAQSALLVLLERRPAQPTLTQEAIDSGRACASIVQELAHHGHD